MSRIAIKICGLSTAETVGATIAAGASHVGFVFFAKSPRNVSVDQAAALVAPIPLHVRRVAVVVNADDELLARLAPIVDAFQLHGSEPPQRVAEIRARFGRQVWKAIPVKTASDIATASAYAGAADFLLYDAKTPDHADLPGGMGLRFDWTLLQGMAHPLPWGLSGGLDPANVCEAMTIANPPLVDVSSGVESAPGIKDVDKIAAFCNAVSQC